MLSFDIVNIWNLIFIEMCLCFCLFFAVYCRSDHSILIIYFLALASNLIYCVSWNRFISSMESLVIAVVSVAFNVFIIYFSGDWPKFRKFDIPVNNGLNKCPGFSGI